MTRSRPFPLTQYYVAASLAATIVIGATLTFIVTRQVRQDQLAKSKEEGVRVIQHLQRDILQDFIDPIERAGGHIDIVEDRAQHAALDAVVQRACSDFDIQALYVFDTDGLILYSTRPEHIGHRTPMENELFQAALRGEVASAVRNRGAPLDLGSSEVKDVLLETYVPVHSIVERLEAGRPVANVIETYRDIDDLERDLRDAQWRAALSTVAGCGLLFAVLFGIVHYADRLIRRQTNALVDSNRQLTDLTHGLEREVDRRTQELIQKEKLASLGTLAAGLAHEVNNPLATIATSAQALQSRLREVADGESLEIEETQAYLKLVEDEAFRVKRITESLLDFSRQSPAETTERVEIRQLIGETVELVAMGGDLDDIEFSLPEREHVIAADRTALRQLVFNILTNAIDAVRENGASSEDPSGGRIAWQVNEDSGQAELVCIDDGIGFESNLSGSLMAPFYTTKAPGAGTGLGLSLCHSMAERLGGRIRIESEGLGRGARVILTIPRESPLGAGRG